MHKIIIDTDPGIDDSMAIHLAFAHPDLDVVGLTTIFGNVHVPIATRNALALAEMAGVACPVAQGAQQPLVQELEPPAYFVHGEDGFGNSGVIDPKGTPDPRSAAQFIVDTINAHPGEITLCPVGPLTNIALALRLDPGIRRKVAQVVIMGGAVHAPGNVTRWAEANIWNDPHAAAEVLSSDWPMKLVGLDVTEKSRCSPEDFAALAQTAPVIGGFLNRAVQFYFDWHRQKAVFDGCFLHDPSAVLAITNPEFFTWEETPVRVATGGEEIGRTRPVAMGRKLQAAVDVDNKAVAGAFLEHLRRADALRDARAG